jgi:hypothetical protein
LRTARTGGKKKVFIGKIVTSYSHINYICQIYGPCEVESPPHPADYAFGRFVRVAVPAGISTQSALGVDAVAGQQREAVSSVIGVIYDTTLLNPAFGSLGPRLSTETQVELFSPDYIAERATLSHILMLGMVEQQLVLGEPPRVRVVHGIPALSPDVDSRVETMTDEDVRLFHYFSDQEGPESQTQYLHMGYLPHLLMQQNRLLPLVLLRVLDQLEHLFPQHLLLLSMMKRNFAWRLKVETTG